MKRFVKIWFYSMMNEAQTSFASRFGVILFLIGKLMRFSFFLFFLILIIGKTQTVAGYSLWEIIFFYATFNLLDTLPQMVLRSVYRFRSYVVNGSFDFLLIQPISPLFRTLFGNSDFLDLPMLFISIGFILYSSFHLANVTLLGVFLYLILLLNALLIALAFHILVVALGVATTEVDNTIMLYRDLSQMGRVPITIYQQGISFVLTFIVPIGIMMSFPSQALLGALSSRFLVYSLVFGASFFLLSLLAWRTALRLYSSASS